MHTQHESTEHRPSRNKILIINSNDNTQSGHSENGLTFKCDYLESLSSRCKDVCDSMKFSRRIESQKGVNTVKDGSQLDIIVQH